MVHVSRDVAARRNPPGRDENNVIENYLVIYGILTICSHQSFEKFLIIEIPDALIEIY